MDTGLPKDKEKALRIDYMQTFGTPQGLRVLEDLAKRCFKHTTTFAVGNETFINEGLRMALLHIEEMRSEEGLKRLEEKDGQS